MKENGYFAIHTAPYGKTYYGFNDLYNLLSDLFMDDIIDRDAIVFKDSHNMNLSEYLYEVSKLDVDELNKHYISYGVEIRNIVEII